MTIDEKDAAAGYSPPGWPLRSTDDGDLVGVVVDELGRVWIDPADALDDVRERDVGTVLFAQLGHGYETATATALTVSVGVLVVRCC
jgi:hypothetical protein